jgi:hypothetical protein
MFSKQQTVHPNGLGTRPMLDGPGGRKNKPSGQYEQEIAHRKRGSGSMRFIEFGPPKTMSRICFITGNSCRLGWGLAQARLAGEHQVVAHDPQKQGSRLDGVSFFTHGPVHRLSGLNAGKNGINQPALTVFGLASAIWDQAEPRFSAFLVCRTSSQTGASELGGPDGPGDDEFPLCRIHSAQSNAALRRHHRGGTPWSLARRHVRLQSGYFPSLDFRRFGDCDLQVRPISE